MKLCSGLQMLLMFISAGVVLTACELKNIPTLLKFMKRQTKDLLISYDQLFNLSQKNDCRADDDIPKPPNSSDLLNVTEMYRVQLIFKQHLKRLRDFVVNTTIDSDKVKHLLDNVIANGDCLESALEHMVKDRDLLTNNVSTKDMNRYTHQRFGCQLLYCYSGWIAKFEHTMQHLSLRRRRALLRNTIGSVNTGE